MIKIYDSFSQTLKPLSDNENKQINMYLCGPTVYNYIHIGNARGIIVFDVLHRLLIHQKYKINYVHNITDIDDKIIKQALQLNVTETDITNKYSATYMKDLATLNIISPTILPKVSDYIPQIINFISGLIIKNYAYVIAGDVYFKVNVIKDYGALSHKKIEDLIPNFRIKKITAKLNDLDFVLWKATTLGTSWDSPWGKGRPGWHTECTVFVQQLFNGQTINLHGGGIDLKFPHHENERAQFIINNNQEMAHIWWHNGHVKIAAEKMSKSLNNFVLVKDFCKKYQPNVLRYLILNRQHHHPLDFNSETLENSVTSIKKYENVLKHWSYQLFINNIIMTNNYNQLYYNQIINSLSNNINTTNIITLLETMVKHINEALLNKDFSGSQQDVFTTFNFTLQILGFNFKFGNYNDETKTKIKKWEHLKKTKQYVAADEIRKQLKKNNII